MAGAGGFEPPYGGIKRRLFLRGANGLEFIERKTVTAALSRYQWHKGQTENRERPSTPRSFDAMGEKG